MKNNKEEKESAIWILKVTKSFDNILEDIVKNGTYATKAEYIRLAVREKMGKKVIDSYTKDVKK